MDQRNNSQHNSDFDLDEFLKSAPKHFRDGEKIKKFQLKNGDYIHCILWNFHFYMTGTDIVKVLVWKFQSKGRSVCNTKKFEEGVFSDLRNLKPGIDATLENPRSDFLEFLYKNGCIRTQKKQKVFFWYSVPHEALFMDALERDMKRDTAIHSDPRIPKAKIYVPTANAPSTPLQVSKAKPYRSSSVPPSIKSECPQNDLFNVQSSLFYEFQSVNKIIPSDKLFVDELDMRHKRKAESSVIPLSFESFDKVNSSATSNTEDFNNISKLGMIKNQVQTDLKKKFYINDGDSFSFLHDSSQSCNSKLFSNQQCSNQKSEETSLGEITPEKVVNTARLINFNNSHLKE